MKKLLPLLLQCIFFATLAFATDQTIGLPADTGQGNTTPFGGGYSGRYQHVYTGRAFSGIIIVTSLQFFNTQARSNATSMPSGNWTISLSTTSADWNTLSNNFSANVGGDNTLVFSGNLSQPWAFGKTLTITLSKPFAYNPRRGSLLMDVNVSGVTGAGLIYFDTTGYNGGARNGSTVVGHVDSDGVFSGYGLVTRFQTSQRYGGGRIALLTFITLLAVWAILFMRRAKRA